MLFVDPGSVVYPQRCKSSDTQMTPSESKTPNPCVLSFYLLGIIPRSKGVERLPLSCSTIHLVASESCVPFRTGCSRRCLLPCWRSERSRTRRSIKDRKVGRQFIYQQKNERTGCQTRIFHSFICQMIRLLSVLAKESSFLCVC